MEEIAEEDVGVAQSRRATGSSEIPERKAPSKASSSSSTDPLPQADIEDIEDIKPPVQKSYEELRKERLQQRIQQRTVKIQQLFQSAT